MNDHETTPEELSLLLEMQYVKAYMEKFNKEKIMYRPKPMTDSDLDKFLADIELAASLDAQPQKVPVPRLGKLQALVGLVMFSGALLYLGWLLYSIYSKVAGGIR